MVYSRTSRPEAQESSTSMSMKGSLTGREDVTFSTALPLDFFSTANRRVDSTGEKSTRASRNAWSEASVADKLSSSALSAAKSSISAASGCPSAERTDSLPSPAAFAMSGNAIRPAAASWVVKRFNFIRFLPCARFWNGR